MVIRQELQPCSKSSHVHRNPLGLQLRPPGWDAASATSASDTLGTSTWILLPPDLVPTTTLTGPQKRGSPRLPLCEEAVKDISWERGPLVEDEDGTNSALTPPCPTSSHRARHTSPLSSGLTQAHRHHQQVRLAGQRTPTCHLCTDHWFGIRFEGQHNATAEVRQTWVLLLIFPPTCYAAFAASI